MITLIWHCAWCTGGTQNLPKLPEGQAYTSGICKPHVAQLRQETRVLHANMKEKEGGEKK